MSQPINPNTCLVICGELSDKMIVGTNAGNQAAHKLWWIRNNLVAIVDRFMPSICNKMMNIVWVKLGSFFVSFSNLWIPFILMLHLTLLKSKIEIKPNILNLNILSNLLQSRNDYLRNVFLLSKQKLGASNTFLNLYSKMSEAHNIWISMYMQ